MENVKAVMQDNITQGLQNCVKLESIQQQAEELQMQAGVFKKNAVELRKKMRCKEIKTKVSVSVCFCHCACVSPSLSSITLANLLS